MPRDPRVYLQDILEAITRIQVYVEGLDRPSFDANKLPGVREDVEKLAEDLDL